MKFLLLISLLLPVVDGGDRERGLQLYKAGKYAEAQAAFQSALGQDPDSAELQWNLALAAWRAGDLSTAEVAAEKYAAASESAKGELHRGLLGAVRFAEALSLQQEAEQLAAAPPQVAVDQASAADPLPILEKALEKAEQSKDHFVRGVRANPTPELLRNTERALRKIEELKKAIEELKKQREEQSQQDDKQPDDSEKSEKSEKQDGEESSGENKDPQENEEGESSNEESKEGSEGQQEQSEQQGEESDPAEQQQGEGSPESEAEPDPNQDPGEQEDPSSSEGQQEPPQPPGGEDPQSGDKADSESQEGQSDPPEPEMKQAEERTDAPGENGQQLELTPEQSQRLQDLAKRLDAERRKILARRASKRRSVERDW
jgi:Ca-activated chloride channel homolog